MKKLLIACASILLLVFSSRPASAMYDPRTIPNNKVGVHILSPSELEGAAKLVNSEGGDWGYVTVPIQPTDRDKDKWTAFMEKCLSLHLIPIIRITTIPQGGTWETGADTDLVDFANFLNELPWPVENRYIVLFNEVNRSQEWGGAVDPEKYASIVKNARTIFKERSGDFFLLGPALDDSLPDSATSMSARKYLARMAAIDPTIWSYFDGWAAHSYPNPGFAAAPTRTGIPSLVSYQAFQKLLGINPLKPVFITETGWDQTKLPRPTLISYWGKAWDIWNHDPNVVAVTPFVLSGGDPYKPFALIGDDGALTTSGQAIQNLTKLAGSPKPGTDTPVGVGNLNHQSSGDSLPWFKASRALLKLENIFRVILGLPQKSTIVLSGQSLDVELAQTPSQWEKGLSGRAQLDTSDGMLFVFPFAHIPVFWMKDTHFPLDMVWILDDTVVDITPNVPVSTSDKLPTYSPKSPVNRVLELPAGWSDQHNLVVGDTLSI